MLRSVIVEAANALALNSALVSVQHVSCLILESLSPNALHKQIRCFSLVSSGRSESPWLQRSSFGSAASAAHGMELAGGV